MSTWRSHHRASTFVAAVTLAVLAGQLTPAGTAQGAATDPGPVVTLPFSNQASPSTRGATGPDELNSLVARACNSGAPLADQQWFTLPSAGSGLIVGRVMRELSYGHDRTPDLTPVGIAVVDHVARRVLRCGEEPVAVTDGQPRSFVAWSDAQTLEECAAAGADCNLFPLEAFVNWTSGRPPNDRWSDATTIGTVPYSETVDTTLADHDHPDATGNCPGSPSLDVNTVWWRFTPTVSGALPLQAQSETFGPPEYQPVFRAIASIGRLRDSGSGPPVEPVCADADRLVEVEAGTTYLIWVHDEGYDGSPETAERRVVYGGRATLTVGALRPTPPQDVTTIPGDGSVVLTWNPPEFDGSSPIIGYQVTQVTGSGVGWRSTRPASARHETVTGLENDSSATFRITAINAAGPGNPAEIRATPTAEIRPPSRPTDVSFVTEADPRRVTVTWKPPLAAGSGPVTGYRLTRSGVDRSGAGPLSVLLPADARKYVLSDLKTYAPYTITLSAVNEYGDGPPVETRTTLYPLTPSEPREVTAVGGARSALVTWQPPEQLGWGGYLLNYRIRRYANGSTAPELTVRVAGDETSLRVTGLTPGVAYRFDVSAINEVGTGEPSPRTEPVTPVASASLPSAPTAVHAGQGKALSTVKLSWEPPALDSGTPVTGYRVSRNGHDTKGNGPWSTTLPADTRGFTFAHLRSWDTYTLSVQAINKTGTGPAATSTILIQDLRPSEPRWVNAIAGPASATVTWEPPQFQPTPISGYRIRRFAGSGDTVQGTATVSADARSLLVQGLTNGQQYRFDVTALSWVGTGWPSDVTAVVVPVGVPGAPAIGTASSGEAGVTTRRAR